MSNVLRSLTALVDNSVKAVKIMSVIEIKNSDTVVVEADGEKRVVKGRYTIGKELLVTGTNVVGVVKKTVKNIYI